MPGKAGGAKGDRGRQKGIFAFGIRRAGHCKQDKKAILLCKTPRCLEELALANNMRWKRFLAKTVSCDGPGGWLFDVLFNSFPENSYSIRKRYSFYLRVLYFQDLAVAL